jgi:hypothetical protein
MDINKTKMGSTFENVNGSGPVDEREGGKSPTNDLIIAFRRVGINPRSPDDIEKMREAKAYANEISSRIGTMKPIWEKMVECCDCPMAPNSDFIEYNHTGCHLPNGGRYAMRNYVASTIGVGSRILELCRGFPIQHVFPYVRMICRLLVARMMEICSHAIIKHEDAVIKYAENCAKVCVNKILEIFIEFVVFAMKNYSQYFEKAKADLLYDTLLSFYGANVATSAGKK